MTKSLLSLVCLGFILVISVWMIFSSLGCLSAVDQSAITADARLSLLTMKSGLTLAMKAPITQDSLDYAVGCSQLLTNQKVLLTRAYINSTPPADIAANEAVDSTLLTEYIVILQAHGNAPTSATAPKSLLKYMKK